MVAEARAWPTGTVTFLFTDIEGSTRLWDRQPDAMRVALERHDEILRSRVANGGGVVFSTGGDGLAAAFAGASDAVAAAMAAQHDLATERWPSPLALAVRMGAHTGEAQERDGDYFGTPVNLAARLMGAAHGGQVVVSATTAACVEGDRFDLVDLGLQRLRGLSDPVHAFGVATEAVPWLDRPLAAAPVDRGNLPAPPGELVGRAAELERVVADLPAHHLITLTGTGGVGKTRLAIEVAWRAAEEFADGTWFVDLGPVSDPTSVVEAVAGILSVRPRERIDLRDLVAEALQGQQALLLLDGGEHVLTTTHDLVERLVTSCPMLRVLVTSREPLGLPVERVHRVASLDPAREGLALFIRQAQESVPDFDPRGDELDIIIEICRRLDGIPLAIELVAPRVAALSPQELLTHLDQRLRLLGTGRRFGVERHRTLRATIDWSYDLLGPDERRLLDRLSVFVGAFDLDAVAAVCLDEGDRGPDRAAHVELLADLVDRSMVQVERTSPSGTRYRLLGTIRQYATERLDRRGELDDRRARHLQHHLELATTSRPGLLGRDDTIAIGDLTAAWHDLRAAHSWALEHADRRAGQLVAALDWYGYFTLRSEVGQWASRSLLEGCVDDSTRPVVAGMAAIWAIFAGDQETALDLIGSIPDRPERPRPAPPGPDPEPDLFWACYAEFWVDFFRGHVEAARAAIEATAAAAGPRPFENLLAAYAGAVLTVLEVAQTDADLPGRAAAAAERIGNVRAAVVADVVEGLVVLTTVGAAEALPTFRRAIDRCRDGDAVGNIENLALEWTGFCLATAGDTPTAAALAHEIVIRLRAMGIWADLDMWLGGIAATWASGGAVEAAAVVLGYLGAADPDLPRFLSSDHDRAVALVRRHPDHHTWSERGASMERDQVVAFTLDTLAHQMAGAPMPAIEAARSPDP